MPEGKPLAMAVVTLFPEMFTSLREWGVTGRAFDRQLATLALVNPRDFASDRHNTVDDRPYGGGPGMVMQPAVLDDALNAARRAVEANATVVALTPQGQVFNDQLARELADQPALIFVAGRYEGMDERFIERSVDMEVSVGDYVVSGGELPAMLVMDAVLRLRPGVLGHSDSANEDSFAEGLLDYPHYTRPEEYLGVRVPEVLLSGDHGKIASWRRAQSLRRTLDRRPDLLGPDDLSSADWAELKLWGLD
jgi:tRNA (guanine37-N1)-methyltransferase